MPVLLSFQDAPNLPIRSSHGDPECTDGFASVGIEKEKVEANPASDLRRTEDNTKLVFLNDAEESRLRAAIQKRWPEYVPAFDVSLYTGMRASEQLKLQWRDVEFKNGLIYLGKTKNRKKRYIRMNSFVVSTLPHLKGTRRSRAVRVRELRGKSVAAVTGLILPWRKPILALQSPHVCK